MQSALPSLVALAMSLLIAWDPPALAQEPPESAADATLHVEHDPEHLTAKVTIRAAGSRVAWADVLRGLARARGYEDSALDGLLPNRSFDPTKKGWRRTLTALNLALAPGMRFDVEPAAAPDGEARLVITLDRTALLASQRRFKARLRKASLRVFSNFSSRKAQYGLALDQDWERAPDAKDLVVFIHGLDSEPEHCSALREAVRKRGLPCGTFGYPNDQPVIDSAKLFSRELKRIHKAHPHRRVALVTHSLGGLVARATIEDPDLDPGNVRRLIMVAPPNQGSALARFEFGLDLWEHLVEGPRRHNVRALYDLIEDGLSEAAGDLKPESPLLRQLNARPRNPAVRYSIFLGTDGPLSEDDLTALRRATAKAGTKSRWVRFFGPRLDAWLADLDEVLEGRGDGAVSLQRGRLQGVDDVVVLKFRHCGVLGAAAGADLDKLRQEVLKRLDEPP